ncbi:putative plasma membrane low affinity zinc ion transporter [Microthyrium microscopicum]|uniref:Putative plasma membrane low affinity zinc ion transporter n=1 Tax=Microthyrium microscopicum TaxID=703497 RepID=A0A6A6UGY5_9PEZI|nr:putative plasma membrane low affinity zinc ion transporter [Microthyrium microscopicum]
MDNSIPLLRLFTRDDEGTTPPACNAGNDYDGRIGVRISAIFVILVMSTLGALVPVISRRRTQDNKLMEKVFFFAKYFGSGVIVATAFIHLLAPAVEALTDPCLTGPITDYSWPFAICLFMIFSLLFVEIMALRYSTFGADHGHDHSPKLTEDVFDAKDNHRTQATTETSHKASHAPGSDHLGHARGHMDFSEQNGHDILEPTSPHTESLPAQLTAIFILEFGIIFHSIFIGLTLAVAGDEFTTLYIVLVFHQTFEGLGLGTRLASVPWPKSHAKLPYWMALGYGLSTPVAIAIGLGVRTAYPPASATTLIVNGIFDSFSAGILIYTGLVELMAHEFIFSPQMRNAPIKTVIAAFVLMCFGAGIMALLGKWA